MSYRTSEDRMEKARRRLTYNTTSLNASQLRAAFENEVRRSAMTAVASERKRQTQRVQVIRDPYTVFRYFRKHPAINTKGNRCFGYQDGLSVHHAGPQATWERQKRRQLRRSNKNGQRDKQKLDKLVK